MGNSLKQNAGQGTLTTDAATSNIATGPSVLDQIVIHANLVGTLKVYDDDDGTDSIFLDLPIGFPAGSYRVGRYCNVGIRRITSATDKVLFIFRDLS